MTPLLCTSGEKQATRHCRIAQSGDPEYPVFSNLIAQVFANAYGAEVMVSYPTLLGVCGPDGRALAALGVREAATEKLFLENYLDAPAEKAIAAKTGLVLERADIAEAGNLASLRLAAFRDLMFALSLSLRQQGISYILFTGTESLRRYLEALGLVPIVYAEANPARLGASAKLWGSYYDKRPKVMGGTTEEFYYGLLAAYGRKDELA